MQPQNAKSSPIRPRTLIFSVIGFLLVAAIGSMIVQAQGATTIFEDVSPMFLLFALASHFVTISALALRLRVATEIHPSKARSIQFLEILDMTLLHNFLVSFLPARVADGCYPVLLARRVGVSVGAGIGNLLLIRAFDVFAICLIISAATGFVLGGDDAIQVYTIIVPVLLIAVMLTLYLDRILGIVLRPSQRVSRRFGKMSIIPRMMNQARRWIREHSTGDRLILGLLSLAPWVSSSVTYVLIFKALDIDVTWARAAIAGKFAEIAGAIPVQMFGGIGAGEGAMTATLISFGLPVAKAAILAVAIRLLLLFGVGIFFSVRSFSMIWLTRGRIYWRSLFDRIFGPTPVFEAPGV